METFKYIHSKGLFIQDITLSNIAIGNSKENMNKVFVFDFSTSTPISEKNSPKENMLLLGLILLQLNGVEFQNKNAEKAIESMYRDHWDHNYVKVSCNT